MDDGAASSTSVTNAVNLVAPYTNSLDVTCSNDPFVAKASNDFRLNLDANGGGKFRATGAPGTFLNNTPSIGYLDMGALQHSDASAGLGPFPASSNKTYLIEETILI